MNASWRDGDFSLLHAVLARDQRAWREFVRRFDSPLREVIREAEGEDADDDRTDDVIGELWLRLLDDDMRALRAFDPARGIPMLAWLAVRATQIVESAHRREASRPRVESLDAVPEPADPRPLPDAAPGVTYLTTAEARRYLRYRTESGIRNAVRRGELVPVGRGPRGMHLFTVAELDRFVLVRAQASRHDRGYRETPGQKGHEQDARQRQTWSQFWPGRSPKCGRRCGRGKNTLDSDGWAD